MRSGIAISFSFSHRPLAGSFVSSLAGFLPWQRIV